MYRRYIGILRSASGHRRAVAGAVLLAAVALGPGVASAHQSSFTYGELAVSADENSATYSLRLNARDLFEALALDSDRTATAEEIRTGGDGLYSYVEERVKFSGDESCAVSRAPVRVVEDGERFAEVAWSLECEAPQESFTIDYDLFFDLDEMHVGLLRVDGQAIQLKQDENHFVYRLGEAPPDSILAFIGSGIDHIIGGPDHILFLAALLLMAVITRSEKGGWSVRPLREALAYTGVIVTAFTIAHSVTLIGAALGWFELPSRLVESVIAASIVYVAIENAVRPDPPRRYLVTFIFGLIHGLGFASMLRPLLPPEDVVLPLLAFNVGVEIGQLAIVIIALPALYGIAAKLTADRYRSWVLPVTAAQLAAIGLLWLIERAFEVEIFAALGF